MSGSRGETWLFKVVARVIDLIIPSISCVRALCEDGLDLCRVTAEVEGKVFTVSEAGVLQIAKIDVEVFCPNLGPFSEVLIKCQGWNAVLTSVHVVSHQLNAVENIHTLITEVLKCLVLIDLVIFIVQIDVDIAFVFVINFLIDIILAFAAVSIGVIILLF